MVNKILLFIKNTPRRLKLFYIAIISVILINIVIRSSFVVNYQKRSMLNDLRVGDLNSRSQAAYKAGLTGDTIFVEPLISCLKDQDVNTRKNAIIALKNIGDTRAIDSLLPTLADEDNNVRIAAVDAFNKFIDKRSIGPLINCLHDKDFLINSAALSALIKNGDASVDQLLICLKDENISVLKSALFALEKIGNKRVIPSIVDILPIWEINSEIISTLTALNWHPNSDAENVYYWIATKNKSQIVSHWEMTKQILMNDLKTMKSKRAINAVNTFICIGKPEILNELVSFLLTIDNTMIAEFYVNSGNKVLEEGAYMWAKKFGYTFNSRIGGMPLITWQSW